MHDQTTAHAGGVIAGPPAGSLPSQVLNEGPEIADLGQYPIAVLSAAVLRAARQVDRESRAGFAARAVVPVEVVGGAEDGTRPAWALSYLEFTALADAVSSGWSRPGFEIAAACDLLLSCVLSGDQVFAADALTGGGTRELAGSLLRWAITGDFHTRGRNRVVVQAGPLLTGTQVALLRDRAVALAASGSPDAWVGVDLLAAGWGGRP
jgi:hypothetical protein